MGVWKKMKKSSRIRMVERRERYALMARRDGKRGREGGMKEEEVEKEEYQNRDSREERGNVVLAEEERRESCVGGRE